MGRVIASWALLIAGLAGVVGGLGQGYIATVAHEAAVQKAKADASMDPLGQFFAPPPRKKDLPSLYGIAALSVALGGVLVYVGLRLRASGPEPGREKRSKKKKKKEVQVCPACGGSSPLAATTCYHCGEHFSP
jgi:hypothetical protein